jgi:hypothetical protein
VIAPANCCGGPAARRAARRILPAVLLLTWSAATASGEVRDVRINRDSVQIGLAGHVRLDRWALLRVEISAKGDDDAPLVVEAVARDLDGDRVLYSRNTFVAELRSRGAELRPLELYFQPRDPGGGNSSLDLTLVVRDPVRREVLARETLPYRLSWDPRAIPPPGGEVAVVAPERRLVGFLGDRPGARTLLTAGGFRRFTGLYGLTPETGPTKVPAVLKVDPDGTTEAGLRRFAFAELTPDDLPALPMGLSAMDVLVWAPTGRESLAPAQQRVIADWVAGGGHLIVCLGRNAAEVRTQFPATPPAVSQGSSPAPDGLLPVVISTDPAAAPPPAEVAAALRRLAGAEAPVLPPLAAASIAPRGPTNSTRFWRIRPVLTAGPEGPPLVVDSRFGDGSVTVAAFNPAEDPLADWAGLPPLWRGLLGRCAQLHPVREYHSVMWRDVGRNDRASDEIVADPALDRAVEDFRLPGVGPGVVLSLLIVYALMVGPGSWFLLRHYNALRWGWPVFAGLVGAAAVVAYGTVSVLRGVTTRHIRLTVLDLPGDGGPTSGWNFDSVYSPGDGEFRFAPPPGGWVAPWVWTDEGEGVAGAAPAGDSYSQTIDPGGRPATEVIGVPIRNHLKKFLSRWWGGRPVGGVRAEKLHIVMSPVSDALSAAFDREGDLVSGMPADKRPRQVWHSIRRVDYRIANTLKFDLDDCILVVWPHLADGKPETVVGHRPGANPDANVPPRNIDLGSTQGAAVVRLGRLPAGQTAAGSSTATAKVPPPPGPESLWGLNQWLVADASGYPRSKVTLTRMSEFPLDRAATTVSLLSLQHRLRFDPVMLPHGAAVNTAINQGFGVVPGFRDPETLGVRGGSLGFLDLSAGLRPDEALLIGTAVEPPDLESAELQYPGGGKLDLSVRRQVVVRVRLPVTAEVLGAK